MLPWVRIRSLVKTTIGRFFSSLGARRSGTRKPAPASTASTTSVNTALRILGVR